MRASTSAWASASRCAAVFSAMSRSVSRTSTTRCAALRRSSARRLARCTTWRQSRATTQALLKKGIAQPMRRTTSTAVSPLSTRRLARCARCVAWLAAAARCRLGGAAAAVEGIGAFFAVFVVFLAVGDDVREARRSHIFALAWREVGRLLTWKWQRLNKNSKRRALVPAVASTSFTVSLARKTSSTSSCGGVSQYSKSLAKVSSLVMSRCTSSRTRAWKRRKAACKRT
mmetsp:Transcript_25635/g.83060  ORF Transcript_25635/g.83060 Transcript_25635/m.83060 type:complete len:229 (+) Transcript_25635:1323-2009(+)